MYKTRQVHIHLAWFVVNIEVHIEFQNTDDVSFLTMKIFVSVQWLYF